MLLSHKSILCIWVIEGQFEIVSQKHKVILWLKCTKWFYESTAQNAFMTQKHKVLLWIIWFSSNVDLESKSLRYT